MADEIAYAAHDLEDALSCGLVNIEDIYYEFRISDEYNPALKDFRKLVSNSWKVASRAYKLESSEEFSIIFRKELTSNIVNKLCKDINIIDNENGFEELGFKSHKKLSEGLKNFYSMSLSGNAIFLNMNLKVIGLYQIYLNFIKKI
ncbi:hypothetical protein [Serratia symbiotica]|uniref:hypothetical protein n=1 Tax=Serratia symbiotica TaxID=138074 RepID=UPI001FFD4053|nr:hypothetical protein [Serratia symbiotica]